MSSPINALPATNANLVDVVYAGILEAISSGEFAQNARLPTEAELTERFFVSRPTVREALSRLRVDGLIASRRGSGSYVLRRPERNLKRFAPIENIADVVRCFNFRVALESAAAGLAAEAHQPEDLEAIRTAILHMESSVGTEGGITADVDFHLAIARASHNSYFVTALTMIGDQIETGMRLSRDLAVEVHRERIPVALREHRDIFIAIRERKSLQAAEAMRLHLGNSLRTLFDDTPTPCI